jgi:hypothetical protein
MTKPGTMSIRNEAWSCWFGQDFSRLYMKLQEEKVDFCLYKIKQRRKK